MFYMFCIFKAISKLSLAGDTQFLLVVDARCPKNTPRRTQIFFQPRIDKFRKYRRRAIFIFPRSRQLWLQENSGPI